MLKKMPSTSNSSKSLPDDFQSIFLLVIAVYAYMDIPAIIYDIAITYPQRPPPDTSRRSASWPWKNRFQAITFMYQPYSTLQLCP